VQEILVSLHTVRHTYDRERAFMPWILTIAHRRIADAARRRYARSALETTVDRMPETFPSHEAKADQEAVDNRDALHKALALLPAGQREAVKLLKIKGLSLEEASKITGRSVASLKVNVHRGLKAMRRALDRKN
jgi:RNA polymerase sigma factor (sigma-70 family)